MQPIIKVNNLVKCFGPRTAVDQLSFELFPGQILGLLGPNGAGKTTTMRMLMGLSRPSSGSIEIFQLRLATNLKTIQAQIGVVFEKPNLFDNLSAYHNLAIYCKLYDKPVSLVQPLLERMELWERAHEPVKHFSKGMKQRVLILRSLIHQPRLLFLDEPASGLDPVSAQIIWDYLKEQTAKGMTVILTSHDMQEVEQLCDQIGFINHGKLITLATTKELKTRYGQTKLKVTYQQDQFTQTKIIDPTPENFLWIQQLYNQQCILSLHSMEASLTEIFQRLSTE